jgi:hypothetical protein
MRIKADSYPPRGARDLPELDVFWAAFGVHPGYKIYLPRDARVPIW